MRRTQSTAPPREQLRSRAWDLLSALRRRRSRRRKSSTGDGRRIDAHSVIRVRIDDALIADAVAVRIDPAHRLLEQTRLGIALRHGALEDIQLVVARRDVGEGA